MELAQLLQASNSVASTPPWDPTGSPAPERTRTQSNLDTLLNAAGTALEPAHSHQDDPAALSTSSQLGKHPREGDSIPPNFRPESTPAALLAPPAHQNSITTTPTMFPGVSAANGMFGQQSPPKLAFGSTNSTTAPVRMFGLPVAPATTSLQFSQIPANDFEYNIGNDYSQPRQEERTDVGVTGAIGHDAGVASGSERTLELALAELLSEDRRVSALEALEAKKASNLAKRGRQPPAPEDEEMIFGELPEEDEVEEDEYVGHWQPKKERKKMNNASHRKIVAKSHAGATTGRVRKAPVPLAMAAATDPIPQKPRAERKPSLSTANRKTTLQREPPSVASSSAGTPVHPSSHTASPVLSHQRPVFSATVRGAARATSPFDSYTPNGHSSEEDDEEFDSSTARRKGKGRAMRDATERARVVPESERDDRLYCVCSRLYDPDRMMLACDKCEDWYHPECVQIPEAHVDLVDQFVCPNCEKTSILRTTWKQRCARTSCLRPIVPLSKYCSDYCGIEVAVTRLELCGKEPERFWGAVVGARRREGAVVMRKDERVEPKVVAENDMDVDEPLKELGPTPAAALEQAETDARSLATLQEKLLDLVPCRQFLESRLGLITARLRYLTIAIRRWEAICQATAQVLAAEGLGGGKSSKSAAAKRGTTKKTNALNRKAAATNMADAQCGFDVRLVYGDEEWEVWVGSAEGIAILGLGGVGGVGGESSVEGSVAPEGAAGMDIIEGVCLLPRKKCERHTGWQKVREADYEVERAVLSRRLDRIAAQEQRINVQIEDQIQSADFRLKHRGKVFKKLAASPEPLIDAPLLPVLVEAVNGALEDVNEALTTESTEVAKMEIEEEKQDNLVIDSAGLEGVATEGAETQENGAGEVDQNTHFVEGMRGD